MPAPCASVTCRENSHWAEDSVEDSLSSFPMRNHQTYDQTCEASSYQLDPVGSGFSTVLHSRYRKDRHFGWCPLVPLHCDGNTTHKPLHVGLIGSASPTEAIIEWTMKLINQRITKNREPTSIIRDFYQSHQGKDLVVNVFIDPLTWFGTIASYH